MMNANQYLINKLGEYCSPQVSYLEDVNGTYESKSPFVVKNNNDDPVWVEIIPASQKEYIKTLIDPGWNPELCIGVKGASNLQIGR